MKRRSEKGVAPPGPQGEGPAARVPPGGDGDPPVGSPRPRRRRSSWLFKTLILHLFVIYVSVPFLVRLFPALLAKFVFLNIVAFPFVDFGKPELLLNHTVNFYLTTEPEVTVGVWHVLPGSRGIEAQGKDHSWYEETLADDNPVMIYLHGNGGNSVTLLDFLNQVMSGAGFHILALDYRGYGDSSGYPSETGFTTDVMCLYDWVKARSGNSTVLFWGHSLGSGVATNVARKLLEEKGIQVDLIVLESAYTNIREAAAHIPITRIYRQFPGFEYFILDSMALGDMFFRNDENVKVLSSPLLILHSEDDPILPVHLGRKLFEIALHSYENKDKVKFVAFPEKLGLAHENIFSDPELPDIVKDFLKNIK
ncbi:39S ribosomal protein L47, mitochondrial [Platysternon megacephalum]|uniref:39S ribosomal protein L47, mitochondrial n=1 Tax=Platysternon megacephalum TaxID=55544 RepID=A0A4D9E161_9SAUR|nr:39S ribosomal protein L47, mitochondrial [Platysternon megacephalum]